MLIFVDTEFTDFIDCELISIGMVSEDGRHELYLEVKDFDRSKCNAFVQAAVCTQLGRIEGAQIGKVELVDRLRAWFVTLPDSIFIACDSQHDRDLLIDTLNGDMPLNFAGWIDLQQHTEIFGQAQAKYHSEDKPWHHAFHDAQALRVGWIASYQVQETTGRE